MKDYIELPMRVFANDELERYIKEKEESEVEEWKKSLVTLPRVFISKVRINPDDIISIHEVFSLETLEKNKKTPKMDCINIITKYDEHIIDLTLKEYDAIYSEYLKNKNK
jgi:hypothetical protein